MHSSPSPFPGTPRDAELKPAAAGIYLGVWQPGAPQDLRPLEVFERTAGKRVAIVLWYQKWEKATLAPDINLIDKVTAFGAVPLITWEPGDRTQEVNRPEYSLASILTGRYDEYIKTWALKLGSYGKPVLLRWAHEMNGFWYPWGNNVNGNTADQFIAAWRHLHDMFRSLGATNVQWVWSPNAVITDELPLETLFFPGNEYVDWLALDSFNRAASGWQPFTNLFLPSYQRITALSSKPVMIAETGSGEALPGSGVSKAQWITDALGQELPKSFPRVRALVWFNEDKRIAEVDGEDWRIDSSVDARAAFARAVANPLYRSNWVGG